MQLELVYGEGHLTVNVPDDATVVMPRERAGLPDERAALTMALRQPLGCPPLRDMVQADDTVVIVFSDITRPMPNARVLPVLLQELQHVPCERITFLNGLGTHRPNTPQELEMMLGAEIARNYTIRQHDAWDTANLVDLGRTRYGHRAVINRYYCEATFKLCTGFIEPHLFAGFSGGPKAILPGIAGFEAVMDNHSFKMLDHPKAIWGEIEGNPTWEEIREVALLAPPEFLLNVTLNRHRQITGVFAGELWQAHREGVAVARASVMAPVDGLFDVVLTTNSGYPLDQNLYQAVKGMSCAAQIVKPGGSIVIASECRDGIPNHGEYRQIVHEGGSVQGILALISQPGYRRHDMWEAQLQARIQQRAEVYLYNSYLSDEEVRGMLFEPCHDIEATVVRLLAKHGPGARLCVLPDGPQTIPYVKPA